MSAITWDPKVFQPFTSPEETHLTCNGNAITREKTAAADLNRVVSLVKNLLKEPLTLSTPEKSRLFLCLGTLQAEVRAYNHSVEKSLVITIFHIVLLILTLGIFSLQNAMKVQDLLPEIALQRKELGITNQHDSFGLLREAFPPKEIFALSVDEIWKMFSGPKGLDLWERIFDTPHAKADFAQLESGKLKELIKKYNEDRENCCVSPFLELFSKEQCESLTLEDFTSLSLELRFKKPPTELPKEMKEAFAKFNPQDLEELIKYFVNTIRPWEKLAPFLGLISEAQWKATNPEQVANFVVRSTDATYTQFNISKKELEEIALTVDLDRSMLSAARAERSTFLANQMPRLLAKVWDKSGYNEETFITYPPYYWPEGVDPRSEANQDHAATLFYNALNPKRKLSYDKYLDQEFPLRKIFASSTDDIWKTFWPNGIDLWKNLFDTPHAKADFAELESDKLKVLIKKGKENNYTFFLSPFLELFSKKQWESLGVEDFSSLTRLSYNPEPKELPSEMKEAFARFQASSLEPFLIAIEGSISPQKTPLFLSLLSPEQWRGIDSEQAAHFIDSIQESDYAKMSLKKEELQAIRKDHS